MRLTRRTAAAGLSGLVFGLWIGSASPGAQAPAAAMAPRTPWGEPDLQGTWTIEGELSVPFERPREFVARQTLTDAELASRLNSFKRQTDSENSDFDLSVDDDVGADSASEVVAIEEEELEDDLQPIEDEDEVRAVEAVVAAPKEWGVLPVAVMAPCVLIMFFERTYEFVSSPTR